MKVASYACMILISLSIMSTNCLQPDSMYYSLSYLEAGFRSRFERCFKEMKFQGDANIPNLNTKLKDYDVELTNFEVKIDSYKSNFQGSDHTLSLVGYDDIILKINFEYKIEQKVKGISYNGKGKLKTAIISSKLDLIFANFKEIINVEIKGVKMENIDIKNLIKVQEIYFDFIRMLQNHIENFYTIPKKLIIYCLSEKPIFSFSTTSESSEITFKTFGVQYKSKWQLSQIPYIQDNGLIFSGTKQIEGVNQDKQSQSPSFQMIQGDIQLFYDISSFNLIAQVYNNSKSEKTISLSNKSLNIPNTDSLQSIYPDVLSIPGVLPHSNFFLNVLIDKVQVRSLVPFEAIAIVLFEMSDEAKKLKFLHWKSTVLLQGKPLILKKVNFDIELTTAQVIGNVIPSTYTDFNESALSDSITNIWNTLLESEKLTVFSGELATNLSQPSLAKGDPNSIVIAQSIPDL